MNCENPYRRAPDDTACAACGSKISQPERGRRRRYCERDYCRRTGALADAFATIWEEGWDAAVASSGPLSSTTYSSGHEDGFAAGFHAGRVKDREVVAELIAVFRRHLRACGTTTGADPVERAIRRVNDRHDIEDHGA